MSQVVTIPSPLFHLLTESSRETDLVIMEVDYFTFKQGVTSISAIQPDVVSLFEEIKHKSNSKHLFYN